MKKLTGLMVLLLGAVSVGNAQKSGLDVNAIDPSADPCQDFYQYACGNWMKQNPVPPAYGRWGSFDQLAKRNRATLREILENNEKHPGDSAVDRQLADFYGACMNTDRIEDLGWKPLEPEIKRIRAIQSVSEVAPEVARLQQVGVDVFFTFSSSPDYNNAMRMIAEADEGGLGLPDRDYYTRKDAKAEETRAKYVAHIQQMLEYIGENEETAGTLARGVAILESNMAAAMLTRAERREPTRLNHSVAVSQFETTLSNFNFAQYLAAINAPAFSSLNVTEPEYFSTLNRLLPTTPLNDIKAYLIFHYIHAFAPALSEKFVNANFEFFGRYLRGAQELQPRWERCVQSTDANLGEALGQKYVAVAFAGQSKQKTRQLVDNIEAQMEAEIHSLDWMSEETKQQALLKLRSVANKIGYPERWRDYSSIVLKKDDYVGDLERAHEFEFRRELAKIGKPVDWTEFKMTPPTVNAYYSPQQNNINFPAGILQPPFFSASADMAVNYGAIGSVIGHELTHGFDDQGRQFDANGNLRDWWTPRDNAEFNKRAACISNEYGGFSPVPGVNLNGKLTLGENGADNAGVRLSYLAMLQALKEGQVAAEKEDNFTPQQRFFLGYAQVWCSNVRPEEARQRAIVDPHSPGKFRVDGVVQNMPEFRQAFSCSEHAPMVSANACRVW